MMTLWDNADGKASIRKQQAKEKQEKGSPASETKHETITREHDDTKGGEPKGIPDPDSIEDLSKIKPLIDEQKEKNKALD